jgi:hypothetical protein
VFNTKTTLLYIYIYIIGKAVSGYWFLGGFNGFAFIRLAVSGRLLRAVIFTPSLEVVSESERGACNSSALPISIFKNK